MDIASARSLIFPLLIVGSLGLAGCELLGFESWDVRRAVLHDLDEAYAQIPTTVAAGEAVLITFSTRGNRCVRPSRTDAQLVGAVLTIEPYDAVRTDSGVLCLAAPCDCVHTLIVTFSTPGTVTLRFVGLPRSLDAEVVIEKSLVVT